MEVCPVDARMAPACENLYALDVKAGGAASNEDSVAGNFHVSSLRIERHLF
jgi:hypothetical protein